MTTKRITSTKEDYIRAVYLLEKTGRDGVRIIDLATHMKLARSTVSERAKELVEQKIIVHEKYGKLKMTTKGRAIAKKLTYKHRIVEVFLHETLGMPINKVHKEAHVLEHAFSDDVIAKLRRFLGDPKIDPHGKPIKYETKK